MTDGSARIRGATGGQPVDRGVLEAVATGIISFDRDGRVVAHNEAARRILARRTRDLEDTPLDRMHAGVVTADGTPVTAGALPAQIARREGRPVDEAILGFEALPGHRRWIAVSARPVEAGGPPPYPVVLTLTDVTRERAAEAGRAAIERRWRTSFEAAPIGMALLTLEGGVEEVNDELCRLTGRPAAELRAADWRRLVHPDDHRRCAEALSRLAGGGSPREEVEVRVARADGTLVWCQVSSALVSGEGGIEHLVAHVADVTDRRRFEQELEHLALHDPLTGLLNRRGFEQELAAHIERVRRYGGGGAVVLLDLDHFKRINDSLGHQSGDVVLVAAARALRSRLRRTDVLCRLGGDEFAILLPGAGRQEVEAVAADLLRAVADDVDVPGLRRPITASAGAALVSDAEVDGDALLVAADFAMYEAKAAGRGRFEIADAREPATRAASRRAWIDRIEHALAHDGLVLYAQPVRSLDSDEVGQYELLLRMRGPDGGLVAPDAFLDAAERFGVVERIDEWVVDRAIELLGATGDAGPVMEINVSGRSIVDDALVERIAARLGATGVRPGRLVVEIAETAAVTNLPSARRFAERLAAIGCRFALDDFGAGFGSLQYVKHLPCDFIKIDGEFVRGCAQSAADRVIIDALVGLAHGLGKSAIAEYVVDAATLGVVRRHGVDFAQGFHVGMPEPAERLVA